MATIEKQLPKEEVDAMVRSWMEKKKTGAKFDRGLTYKLYNQFFHNKQRDVNACSCMDRDTDLKVTRHIENGYKLSEPLPIESSVQIDMSSMLKKETTPKARKPRAKKTKTTPKKSI